MFNAKYLAVICLINAATCALSAPQTLVISFDGLRVQSLNEYLEKTPNSFFGQIISSGVRAKYMKPSFPTATFPNHFTIVTGVNPESHGIVGNTIYDPKYNQKVSLKTNHLLQYWNKSVPIWYEASQQGLLTAAFYWVGSEVVGRTPDIWFKYNQSHPFDDRVETVIQWLTVNKTQLTFLYFDQPDTYGHTYGPNSEQYKGKIAEMDSLIGLLISKLKAADIYEKINIVIVSDHGMAEIKKDGILNIYNYVNKTMIDTDKSLYGIVNHIRTTSSQYDEIVIEALKKMPNVKTYRKSEIPESYSYRNDDRIAPIVVIAEEGYAVSDIYNTQVPNYNGDHGYNNSIESMGAIFLARGPYFNKNVTIEPFQNVNVYSLLCEILQIECHSSNGSLAPFKDALKDWQPNHASSIHISNFFLSFASIIVYSLLC